MKTFLKNVSFVGVLFSILANQSFAVNEHDIVITALSRNLDIQLLKVQQEADVLSLRAAQAGWLPTLELKATPKWTPFDSSTIHHYIFANDTLVNTVNGTPDTTIIPRYGTRTSSDYNSELSASGKLVQLVPGGGSFFASVNEVGTFPNKRSNVFSNEYSIGFTQPLLQGAWGLASPAFDVKLTKLDNAKLTFERQKSLLSQLSDVRSLYWNYWEKSSLLTIANNDVTLAEEQLKVERERYKVGESAQIDTLSAALQYMKRQQALLDAQIVYESSRNALAASLAMSPDSLTAPDTASVVIPDLPDPSTITALVEKFDPKLRIFDLLAEKLSLQVQKQRNALFPTLNISGSLNGYRDGQVFFPDSVLRRNAVVSLIFQYTLPVTKTQLSIKQSALEKERINIESQQYRITLDKKLRDLQHSWRQEKHRITLAEASVELARKQLTAAQKSYELGTVDRLFLLQARDDLTSSENSLVMSRIGMKRLEIIIDEMTGTLLQRFGVTAQ